MSTKMTAAQLRELFPRMSEATIQMNASDGQPAAVVSLPPSLPSLVAKAPETKAGGRVRQRLAKKMNKTETDFFLHLQNLTAGKIRYNAVRFELANNLHFKPDFTVDMLQVYEAKGPWASRDAFPRLKMAARLYPEMTWFLATRAKGGRWDVQHILP